MRKDDCNLYVKVLASTWAGKHIGPYSFFKYEGWLGSRNEPGPWLPAVKLPLMMCVRGYHVTNIEDFLMWGSPGSETWIVQTRGETLSQRYSDKLAAEEMRFICKVKWAEPENTYHSRAFCDKYIREARQHAFKILRKEKRDAENAVV